MVLNFLLTLIELGDMIGINVEFDTSIDLNAPVNGAEEKLFNIMFIGQSLAHCNWNPDRLWPFLFTKSVLTKQALPSREAHPSHTPCSLVIASGDIPLE